MDAFPRKLTQLLDSDDIELRIAAVRIVAEIGLSSKAVTKALGRCVQEENETLRMAALKALAELGPRDIAPVVVPLIVSPGPLREKAMSVVVSIGLPLVPRLIALYAGTDYHGKLALVVALGRIGGKDALSFLVKILPEERFEVQKHIALHLCEALDRARPAVQAPVFAVVEKLLRQRSTSANSPVQVTGCILLGHFRGATLAGKAREALKGLAEKKNPPEVRRHALVSFNRLMPERKLSPADEQFVQQMLCDDDWHNVAQHALTVFRRLDTKGKAGLKTLFDLLEATPHFSVHLDVFDRLKPIDRSEVAAAVIPFLSDPRFRVREAAEETLRCMPSAIESLFAVLVDEDDLDVTQRVTSILRDFPQATRKRFLPKACRRLLSLYEQRDSHYRPFLEFVRAVDPEPLRQQVYERCHRLKTGRGRERWGKLASYLELLWDNNLITAEGRYLLAVAHLCMDGKELAPAARRANLGLQVIRALIYNDTPGLVRRLRTDRDLVAEDYFYLGFHFAEDVEDVRPFARAMLELVTKKYGKTKIAEPASRKLEALEEAEAQARVAAENAKARGGARGRRAAKAKAKAKAQPQSRTPVAAEAARPTGKAANAGKGASAAEESKKSSTRAKKSAKPSSSSTVKETSDNESSQASKSARKKTASSKKEPSSPRPIRIKKSGGAAAKKARKSPAKKRK